MSIYESLYEVFPKEVERTLSKGGARLTYIPVSEVITRLNKVMGVDMWSYQIVSCERDALDPDFVTAHVRLTARFVPTENAPMLEVSRDGVGGQKIKRTKKGDIVDLGDEMKGAVSDALKKAAQSFGIGLYLARSEEALYLDNAEDETDAISEEYFNKLRSVLNSLPQEDIEKAKGLWANISGDVPFVRENVTRAHLETMLEFAKQARANSQESSDEQSTASEEDGSDD